MRRGRQGSRRVVRSRRASDVRPRRAVRAALPLVRRRARAARVSRGQRRSAAGAYRRRASRRGDRVGDDRHRLRVGGDRAAAAGSEGQLHPVLRRGRQGRRRVVRGSRAGYVRPRRAVRAALPLVRRRARAARVSRGQRRSAAVAYRRRASRRGDRVGDHRHRLRVRRDRAATARGEGQLHPVLRRGRQGSRRVVRSRRASDVRPRRAVRAALPLVRRRARAARVSRGQRRSAAVAYRRRASRRGDRVGDHRHRLRVRRDRAATARGEGQLHPVLRRGRQGSRRVVRSRRASDVRPRRAVRAALPLVRRRARAARVSRGQRRSAAGAYRRRASRRGDRVGDDRGRRCIGRGWVATVAGSGGDDPVIGHTRYGAGRRVTRVCGPRHVCPSGVIGRGLPLVSDCSEAVCDNDRVLLGAADTFGDVLRLGGDGQVLAHGNRCRVRHGLGTAVTAGIDQDAVLITACRRDARHCQACARCAGVGRAGGRCIDDVGPCATVVVLPLVGQAGRAAGGRNSQGDGAARAKRTARWLRPDGRVGHDGHGLGVRDRGVAAQPRATISGAVMGGRSERGRGVSGRGSPTDVRPTGRAVGAALPLQGASAAASRHGCVERRRTPRTDGHGPCDGDGRVGHHVNYDLVGCGTDLPSHYRARQYHDEGR